MSTPRCAVRDERRPRVADVNCREKVIADAPWGQRLSVPPPRAGAYVSGIDIELKSLTNKLAYHKGRQQKLLATGVGSDRSADIEALQGRKADLLESRKKARLDRVLAKIDDSSSTICGHVTSEIDRLIAVQAEAIGI